MESKMEAKNQDKIRELRRQNRKLMNELLEIKSQLDRYKQDNGVLARHIVMLENLVLDLINVLWRKSEGRLYKLRNLYRQQLPKIWRI